jgi:DNA-binding MarR family transcriptional regulator
MNSRRWKNTAAELLLVALFLDRNRKLTAREIATQTGLPINRVSLILKRLVARQVLEKELKYYSSRSRSKNCVGLYSLTPSTPANLFGTWGDWLNYLATRE